MAELKWATEERKLQSAYDDLNAQRFKLVEQTLSRYLKKSPKSQPALILRLAYLQRTHASSEAILKAFEDVKSTGELTGRGAWWVNNTLRNIQRWDLIVGLYSDLWARSPDRAELGEQVFLNAAAAWDTDIMVTSSRKMFNLVKSPVWARVAAWSEWVHKAPIPTPSNPFPIPNTETQSALKIAKTLLSLSGAKTPSAEVLWLKLQIILSSGDVQGALKVAREGGGSGNLGRLWWRMKGVKAGILRLLEEERKGEYAKEREWVTELLRADTEAQRNYAFYRYLITCTTHSPSQETLELFTELYAKIGEKERAPLLGSLELDNATVKAGGESRLGDGKFMELLEAYWKEWGSKGCVVEEIEGVCEGEDRKIKEVCEMLEKVADEHRDLEAYREVVNARLFLLRRRTKDWVPEAKDVERLWSLYISGLQYGRNLPNTDIQPADDVGLAAVQLVLIQYHSTRDEAYLLKTMLCLRYIISKSPACAHGHYLLIRICRLIGACDLVIPSSSPLGISEIQLDTLLHPIVERGASESLIGGTTEDFERYVKDAQKMYKRATTDMPEYIKQALENESYSKIHSIRSLSTTLSNSLPHATTLLESIRSSMITGRVPRSGIEDLDRMLRSKEGEMADTRSWELIPEIGGGLLGTREMTSVGAEFDERWIRVWGKVVLGFVASLNDEEEIEIIRAAELVLLPAAERAFINAVIAIRRASRRKATVERDESTQNLKDATGDLVKIATGTDGELRWSRLHPCMLLFEISRYIDLALDTFTKEAKSATTSNGKGKKKATEAVSIRDLAELKEAKSNWSMTVAPVVAMLESITEADENLDWKSLVIGLTEVDSTVESVSKGIAASRRSAVLNLQKCLKGEQM